MLSLLMVAALGQCSSRGYGYSYAQRSYAAPTYYAQQSYAAPVYQQPAQQYAAPQYSYSLVGDYMRQETYEKERAEQTAKLDILLKLLTERVTPPQPQPQFQAPYPSPQSPAKAPPVAQYEAPLPSKQTPQFETPYPSTPYPTEQQPPYGTKPPPASPQLNPSTPSFESSAWVPPPPVASGYGGYGSQGGYGGVAAMTQVMQTRCVDCHVGTSEKGGGVKLLELDGQLADISPYLEDIEKDVTSGRMPKRGGRLNNQELYGVLSGLREYAARSRGRQNVLASFGQ